MKGTKYNVFSCTIRNIECFTNNLLFWNYLLSRITVNLYKLKPVSLTKCLQWIYTSTGMCISHAYYDCILLFPLWYYSVYHHDTNDKPLNNLSPPPHKAIFPRYCLKHLSPHSPQFLQLFKAQLTDCNYNMQLLFWFK